MVANEEQVGGAHYKGKPIEHWDFVLMHNIPYLEAQVIKYMMRWRKKNGVEDLRKARHFIDKLIETELLAQPPPEVPFEEEVTTKEKAQRNLADSRKALSSEDAMNRYMNPDSDSGVPRGKGYVDQD